MVGVSSRSIRLAVIACLSGYKFPNKIFFIS
nr:MAG TPA: hypothetical protein [Bacteriophage sp.]